MFGVDDIAIWFKKYFLNEQTVVFNNSRVSKYAIVNFINQHRRVLSIAIPFCFVQLWWWSYMIHNDLFYLFNGSIGKYHKPRYLLTITMIFGSMIAGSTSEGGAAVAFPILTLVFGVKPSIARDFSFMIQSVGMTSASFTIFFMQVKLEWYSLFWCTIGGAAGVIYGIEVIAPRLTPAYTKMYFVSIWFSFAIALFWLNFYHDRKVYNGIPYWNQGRIFSESTLDISTPYYAIQDMINKYVMPIINNMYIPLDTNNTNANASTNNTNSHSNEVTNILHDTTNTDNNNTSNNTNNTNNTNNSDHTYTATYNILHITDNTYMKLEQPSADNTSEFRRPPVIVGLNWKAGTLLLGGFLGIMYKLFVMYLYKHIYI